MDAVHGDIPHLPEGFAAAASPQKHPETWTNHAALITLAGLGGLGSFTMFV